MGSVAGLLLFALGAGGAVTAPLAGALAGGSAAFTGTCLAVPARLDAALAPGRYRRIVRAARCGVALLVPPTVLAVLAPGAFPAGEVLAWSGPWGWATLPLTGGPPAGDGWAGPALGTTLTLATAVAVGWWAARTVHRVPTRVLRERAAASLRVRAALHTLDLRWARMAARPPRRLPPGRAPRLPLPRRPALVVPWRDATALLREPARPLRAATWAFVAVSLFHLPQVSSPLDAAVRAAAWAATWAAAHHLAEPARLDGDDPRRTAPLPWSAAGTALRHAALPAVLLPALLLLGTATVAALAALLAATGTGAGPSMGTGTGAGVTIGGLALLLCGVPAVIGATLVSAHRGPIPPHLWLGTPTPLGDTGPVGAVLWQVRGPLTALAALAALHHPAWGDDHGAARMAASLLVGAGMLWWGGHTARTTARR
ncbi:hypothetical protein [Streptomyces sp. ST2-7A]|uniref:hypothetical protein n=1 Tax=Streptomyces sp. ST2-7A TaxID=2907214 RepID=UPI001F31E57C|nr:hypothetical protein [Streptomyces sp. ST2-7A]MCE7079878.1 hypothetical protein [Streptomyces sp. ST2-7A]